MASSSDILSKKRNSLRNLPLLDIKLLQSNRPTYFNKFSLPEDFIKDYEVIELIGKGFQAQVFKVKKIDSQEILAAKTYKNIDEEEINSIKNEAGILSSISHPSIVSFHSFLSYPSDKTCILITEYFPGRPLSVIIPSLPSSVLPSFFSTVLPLLVAILTYLKEMSIGHWDLNCSNILYDIEDNRIKVVDFGVAHRIDKECSFYSPEGNPKFRPPLNKRDFNAFEVDLWGVWLVGIGILKGRVVGTKEVEKHGMVADFSNEGLKYEFLNKNKLDWQIY